MHNRKKQRFCKRKTIPVRVNAAQQALRASRTSGVLQVRFISAREVTDSLHAHTWADDSDWKQMCAVKAC